MFQRKYDEHNLDIDGTGTRQFIDKTTHRHGFWRQFIDTLLSCNYTQADKMKTNLEVPLSYNSSSRFIVQYHANQPSKS